MNFTLLFLNYRHLKLKLKVYLIDFIVTMVPLYALTMTKACLTMICYLCDTNVLKSQVIDVWICQSIATSLFDCQLLQLYRQREQQILKKLKYSYWKVLKTVASHLGRVVRKPVNVNPGLNVN